METQATSDAKFFDRDLMTSESSCDIFPLDMKNKECQASQVNEEVKTLEQEIGGLKDENLHLKNLLAFKDEEIKSLRHFLFGKKSEKLSTDQVATLFNEPELIADQPKPKPEKPDDVADKKPKRKKLPATLPRSVENIEIPEEKRICPCNGTPMAKIGEEVSEKIDIIPMVVRVVETRRAKYACTCCKGGVCTAPTPPAPLPKTMATAGTIAYHTYPAIAG